MVKPQTFIPTSFSDLSIATVMTTAVNNTITKEIGTTSIEIYDKILETAIAGLIAI